MEEIERGGEQMGQKERERERERWGEDGAKEEIGEREAGSR